MAIYAGYRFNNSANPFRFFNTSGAPLTLVGPAPFDSSDFQGTGRMVIAPSQDMLAVTVAFGNVLRVFKTINYAEVTLPSQPAAIPTALAWTSDGLKLIAITTTTVYVYDFTVFSTITVSSFSVGTGSTLCASFNQVDNTSVYVGKNNATFEVFNITTGSSLGSVSLPGNPVWMDQTSTILGVSHAGGAFLTFYATGSPYTAIAGLPDALGAAPRGFTWNAAGTLFGITSQSTYAQKYMVYSTAGSVLTPASYTQETIGSVSATYFEVLSPNFSYMRFHPSADEVTWHARRSTGGNFFALYSRKTAGTWSLVNADLGNPEITNTNYDTVQGIGFLDTSMVSDPDPPDIYTEDVSETAELDTDVTDGVGYEQGLIEGAVLTDAVEGNRLTMSRDGVLLSAIVTAELDTISVEIVRMSALLDSTALLHLDVDALARLTESVQIGFTQLLAEAIELDAELDGVVGRYGDLVDTVLTSAPIVSMLQAGALLSEAFAIASMAAFYNDVEAEDGVVMEAAAAALHRANEMVEAMLELEGVADLHNSAFMLAPERVAMGATIDSTAAMQELLAEALHVGAVLDLAGEVYTVLAVNAVTAAVTRYANYPFNSMARVNTDYVGAADDGLYLLEGDTDDGDPIAAGMKTGLMDFGSADLKRVPNVYAGLTRAGRLVLKVVTASRADEAPKERWYALKQNLRGGDVVGGRFELGRGIKSRYWQFEVINVDGDDFELDALDIDLVRLSRRS